MPALAHIQPKLSMDCNPLPLSIPKKIAATSKFRDVNQRPNSALFNERRAPKVSHKHGTQSSTRHARKYRLSSMVGCEKLHPALQPCIFWTSFRSCVVTDKFAEPLRGSGRTLNCALLFSGKSPTFDWEDISRTCRNSIRKIQYLNLATTLTYHVPLTKNVPLMD